MNFNEAYNYLLSLQNIPKKQYMNDAKHCGVYLKRLQFFLDLLGNPEKNIPHYIHVTGTSGKGSVVSYIHSIISASGKKVGSTQSPHPSIITERWRLGNRYMTKEEFVELIEQIKPKLDEYIQKSPYDMLSFFEVNEAIGLLWFSAQKVDYAIKEVGCGGRYDSSNIIPHKDVAIITNIGLDHVGIIGNNKQEIAHEKAGIIKEGAVVLTTEEDPDILAIIQTECDKNNTKLKRPANFFAYENVSWTKSVFNYLNEEYELPTPGEHQVKNACLAIECTKAIGIDQTSIAKGLKNAVLPIKFEVIPNSNPMTIIDSAHNEDKMMTTVKTLQSLNEKNHNILLVCGFSENKNVEEMVKQLSTLNPKNIYATRNTNNPTRPVTMPTKIKELFNKYLETNNIELSLDPINSFNRCLQKADKNDIILATGSCFLAGEIRHHIFNKQETLWPNL